MKRYIKILFSRFTFVLLTIFALFVLGFAVTFGPFYVLRDMFVARFPHQQWLVLFLFDAVQWLILFATVLNIANRDMIPEAKIPWLLCVIALGLFGVMIYAVFSNNRPSGRQRKSLQSLRERSQKYSRRGVDMQTLQEGMGRWASVSGALQFSNSRAVVYDKTKTEYFPTGEKFFERFLLDLRGAKQFIFLEYFIIEGGVMWDSILSVLQEKVKEGVEVRLIYDDIGSMGKRKIRAGYYKTLRKMGIRCVKFNPFIPIVANIHNNRDHRKIAVIDGVIGYTGGINLADEYINAEQPFGVWKDSAVRLEGVGVTSLTLMFLQFYNLRNKVAEDFTPYIRADFTEYEGEGFVQPYGDGPRQLFGKHLGEDVYINVLASAKKYVWIMSPYLIIDYRMREAMLACAARGVDVRIITPHIPDKKTAFALTRSNYLTLIKGGVKIYEFTPGFVHSKSFLADDEVGIVGTINLDYRSLLYHYEDAVLMYGTKANEQLKADYEETFSISALQTEEDAKRSVVWRVVCEILKVFAPLF